MGLLDLPSEIRGRIWSLLLTRPCAVDAVRESIRPNSNIPNSTSHSCARFKCFCPRFSVSILRICKQISLEAIDILYTSNRFILTLKSADEMPLSEDNLQKIRSLMLSFELLDSMEKLHGYERMIDRFNLNPQVHLMICANIPDKTLLNLLMIKLSTMAPAKSCALYLYDCPEYKYSEIRALGLKLTAPTHQRFPKYNDLPPELRRHILGYTDLVQDYKVLDGVICYETECCERCCDTLDICYCNTIEEDGPYDTPAPVRFSSRCQCKASPIALLRVSRSFRAEALTVLFARSRFVLCGPLSLHDQFFSRIERYLPRLRHILLRMDDEDFPIEKKEVDHWEDIVDWLVHHCDLPLLSLTIMGICHYHCEYEESLNRRPLDEGYWEAYRWHYRRIVLGLQRLFFNGLKKMDFQFLAHLEPMTAEFRNLVMGYGEWVTEISD